MSNIKLEGNASGTGTITFAAPNTNTNRTVTLPDEDVTLGAGYTDSDALTLFNATGSAPVYACRAWVNFSGLSTVTIRDSGNVSSITDLATGKYAINYATAMQDSNYAVVGASKDTTSTTDDNLLLIAVSTTRSDAWTVSASAGALEDHGNIYVVTMR